MKRDMERTFLDAYEACADAIFRFCYFRVGNSAVAEDLVQETFTRTWKYLSDGHEIDSLKAFLYRTARNLIIDGSRKKKLDASVEERTELGLEPKDDDAESILLKIEWHELLRKMNLLTDSERELLLLRFVEGYTPKEIACLLQESPNTVSVRIHRAKKTLKAFWKQKQLSFKILASTLTSTRTWRWRRMCTRKTFP